MSTTSFDSVFTVGATRLQVPVGATLALFCQPVQGQLGWYLKYISGGTCEILSTAVGFTNGTYYGTTQPAGTLAIMSGNGYLLGGIGITGAIFETVKLMGPAQFYLSSTGATSIVSLLMLKGQGY
jgi:hypothetical protein